MDAFTDRAIEIITVMKSSRTGGTEAINNMLGYTIDIDPGPALMVRPTDAAAKRWSKKNFDPMIRDTPALTGKIETLKLRSKQNEILTKMYPGGALFIVGAKSPVGLSDLTVRYLFLDEVDRFPPSVGGEEGEGDPVELAIMRTQTYWDHKVVLVSSPTVQGVSRIEESFKISDQRHYHVPCPKCGHFQVLIFGPRSQLKHLAKGFLQFDKDNCTWACYVCENCKAQLGEADKLKMVRQGKWVAHRPQIAGHAGFHISELYSPWSTWLNLAKKFLECEKRSEKYRVFVNTRLGETFQLREQYQFDGDTLLQRRESYTKIPAGPVILTAGVDTQDDRLEAFVYGWGLNERSWFIRHRVIYGSPAYPTTWKMLDDFLFSTMWEHENGYKVGYGTIGGLMAVAIDTGGHHTRSVYEYVKKRKGRRVFAIKGMGGFGKTFLKAGKSKKGQSPVILIGVDAGKQLIYDRLNIVDTNAPGYMHFNAECTAEFFQQLTAEKKVVKKVKGFPTLVWELIEGRKNEALDGTVYALAAYSLLNPNMESLAETLYRRMESAGVLKKEKGEEGAGVEAEQRPVVKKRKRLIIRSKV